MEQKKTAEASLESQRITGFLLGLVLVLAVLFVAFQWTTDESDYDIDEALLDDVAEELLMDAWDDHKDMTVVAIEEPVQNSSDRVEVVEKLPELPAQDEALMASVGEVKDIGMDQLQDEPLPPVSNTLDTDDPLPVRIVEQLPEFPGGMSAFIQWLTKQLRYPEQARQQKIRGRVVVSFIVNRDGSISNAKVAHSADPVLDREAMRVIRMMPRWKPGLQNNEPCRTMVAVPVVFDL